MEEKIEIKKTFSRKTPYVIHEHLAKRAGRHYDLRIKRLKGNLLESWALPKAKFPQEFGEKTLAVRTNPHSRLWLYFEGEITEGHGKGLVKIVQKGEAEILGWGPTYITFKIDGPVASGKFTLIQFKPKKGEKIDTWILIKSKEKTEG